MNKIMGLALVAAALAGTARACDVCGCTASGNSLGILPDATRNFVGIQYLRNSFHSEHPSLFENGPDERSRDYYHTVQLWGRYSIGSRLQVFAFMPYRYNLQRSDAGTAAMSGLGDISILANAVLIRERPGSDVWQSGLLAGGGLKLPTGRYAGVSERDKLGLPNMQPGTGSWDLVLNTNYTLRHRGYGFNADFAYTVTTPNSDRYKYGNRLNAGLLLFRSLVLGKLRLLSQAGIRCEYSLHDYDNFSRRWLNRQSGGYMFFAAAGLQAYYGRLGARVLWQLPLSQQYARGYVLSINKTEAGVFLLF